MADIKLRLRDPESGRVKDHVQAFVPIRKTVEYLKKEDEMFKEYDGEVPQSELDNMRIEFIASLFDDEKITKDYILDGLDVDDAPAIMEIIMSKVLGVKPEKKQEKTPKKKT